MKAIPGVIYRHTENGSTGVGLYDGEIGVANGGKIFEFVFRAEDWIAQDPVPAALTMQKEQA